MAAYNEAVLVSVLLDARQIGYLDGVVLSSLRRGVAVFVLLDEVRVQLQEAGQGLLVGCAVGRPGRRL